MPTAKFITTADFENEPVQIAKNKYTTANLNGFIDKYEYQYLRKILGDDLLTKFFADLSGSTPQHPKFLALLNGETYLDCDGKYVIYEGLKEALKYFIWVEFVRKSNYKNTISGSVTGQNENSNVLVSDQVSILCRDAWNHGAELAISANRFIQFFEFYHKNATSIVFQAGTTYLVSIPDTKFLKNGDTVTINSVNYTIANLIADTSFEIDSVTNIADTDVRVDWVVFDEFDVQPFEYSFLNL